MTHTYTPTARAHASAIPKYVCVLDAAKTTLKDDVIVQVVSLTQYFLPLKE